MDYVLINNELYHHGIKGQKWGIRRFQNEDGSLTADGRKRYSGDPEKSYRRFERDVKKGRIDREKLSAKDADFETRLEFAAEVRSRALNYDDYILPEYLEMTSKDISKMSSKTFNENYRDFLKDPLGFLDRNGVDINKAYKILYDYST